MPHPVRALGLLVAVAASGAFPSVASAQTDIVVLEIRSVEGDNDLVRNLTGALRHAAAQVPGWRVSDREVSLTQMALAFGCEGDEPDAGCMSEIASDLGVNGVIYGTVRRTGRGANYNFELRLSFFNGQSGRIERSTADTIPRTSRDIDDLRDRAERYISELAGEQQVGGLQIRVNVPGAEVRVDGQTLGYADDTGVFSSATVPSGSRQVEVAAPGHRTYSSSVTIGPGEMFELDVELEEGSSDSGPGEGGGPSMIPGIAVLGVGAVAGVALIATWAKLQKLGNDDRYTQFRNRVPDGSNACTEARMEGDELAIHAHDICQSGDRLETLQWVFLGLSLAGLGAGTFLLVHATTHESSSGTALQLTPTFGRRQYGVTARLTF